jgi:antitoxin CptB
MNDSKLRWHCRRGMQELDKLLLGYLEKHYETASYAEQLSFQHLIALEDNVLIQLLLTDENSINSPFDFLAEKIRSNARF